MRHRIISKYQKYLNYFNQLNIRSKVPPYLKMNINKKNIYLLLMLQYDGKVSVLRITSEYPAGQGNKMETILLA